MSIVPFFEVPKYFAPKGFIMYLINSLRNVYYGRETIKCTFDKVQISEQQLDYNYRFLYNFDK